MEYHIELSGQQPDMNAIDDAVRAVDPAVVLDLDAKANKLRVSTEASAAELVSLLDQAGFPIGIAQVRTQPSVCCGGCSG